MLSLSADNSKQEVNLQVINGDGDGGMPLGSELMRFAEALASGDDAALVSSRDALLAVSSSNVIVDAAAVAANFQRMVRIADSTGLPLDGIVSTLSSPIQDELDLRRFPSAQNTAPLSWIQKLLAVPVRFIARYAMRAPKGSRSAKR
jgi:hypothetical protein